MSKENRSDKSLVFRVKEIKERGGLSRRVKPELSLLRETLGPEIKLLALETRVKFSVGTSEILAEGEFDGEWELECSRCSERFTSAFAGSFDETYPESVESIDLADLVRQTVALSVPMKQLCSGDCRGLCGRCGQNLNKDRCGCNAPETSPFAVLKNLKKNKKE